MATSRPSSNTTTCRLPGASQGYSLEVFNAVGETLAVVTLPESQIEALRRDEILSMRSLASHAA